MKKLSICLLLLTAFSIALISVSYAEQVLYEEALYGDLRDYYPFGMWITAKKLDYEPEEYTILANDTYIKRAIDNGNLTWVQQDDPNSTFMEARKPQYILWSPNGNYYFIDQMFVDGYPAWFRRPKLPQPTEIAKLLAIPWIGFLVVVGYSRKKKA